MANICNTTKETMANISRNEMMKEERAKSNISRIFGRTDYGNKLLKDITLDIEDYFEFGEGGGRDQVLNPSMLSDSFMRMYGSKNDKRVYLTEIAAIVNQYSVLSDMRIIQDYLQTNAPKDILLATKKGNYDLRKYPIDNLKNILRELHFTVRNITDKDKSEALFGNFIGQILTPATLAKRSSGLNVIHSSVRDYVGKTQSNVNQFMATEQIQKINPNITLGMQDILSNIKFLFGKHGISDSKINKISGLPYGNNMMSVTDKSLFLFTRYMNGQIKWEPKKVDKKGKVTGGRFMIGTKYEIKRKKMINKEGKVFYEAQRWKDNSLKYEYQDYVPYNEYIPPNREKGYFYLPIDEKDKNGNFVHQKLLDEFFKHTEEARKIDNEVFKWMIKEMKGSLKTLFGEMRKRFKGFTDEQLKTIFFKPETKAAKQLLLTLTKKEAAFLDVLKGVFSMNITDDFVITTGGAIQVDEIEFKQRHWPTLYPINTFKPMLDKLVSDWSREYEELEVKYEKAKGKNKRKYKTDMQEKAGQIANATTLLARVDEYHLDLTTGHVMPFAKDNKYFKRISNAYNLMNGRTDESVYGDYLKHISSSIERNHLSAKLVKALLGPIK